MAENEKTSKRVASLAAKILEMKNPRIITDEFWEEIKSVAGSALTQAPDKYMHPFPEGYYNALAKRNFSSLRRGTVTPDFLNYYFTLQKNK